MKLKKSKSKNKNKNKGKVHPSPSSSSSTSHTKNDPFSSLNHLLPTAILTLISLLSFQDREVLTYMISHSLKSSTSCFDTKPNNKKFTTTCRTTRASTHLSPTFDCHCFACFSSYWNLWNSSPNSELIDQAIEAFEEHLSKTEKHTKKRENISVVADVEERDCLSLPEQEVSGDVDEREDGKGCMVALEKVGFDDVEERENERVPVAGEGEERESGVQQQQQHKGLARKVLPDFIGFFQSRLWNRLWGPNV